MSAAAATPSYCFEELPGRFVRIPVHIGDGPVARPSLVALGSTIVMPDAAALERHMAAASYERTDATPASLFVIELPPRLHQGEEIVDHVHVVALTVAGATPEQAAGDAMVLRRIPWGERSKVHAGRDRKEDRARLSAAHRARLTQLAHRVLVTQQPFHRRPSGLEAVLPAPVTSLAPCRAAIPLAPQTQRLPSAEELAREVASNPALGAIVARATLHQSLGFGGVDVIIAQLDQELDRHALYDVGHQQHLVPFLQRLGFGVLCWSPITDTLVSLSFPGHAHRRRSELLDWQARTRGSARAGEMRYVYPRSFAQVRMRGAIRCVPRLLGMLRAARLRLVNPAADARAACAAAQVDPSELDRLGRTAAEVRALEQDSRKRKLVDALHADEEDTDAGARWAGLVVQRARAGSNNPVPMRIAAVRDGFYCFATCKHARRDMGEVVLLKHDEFDVAWQQNNQDPAVGTRWNGSGLEEEFQWRRDACYEEYNRVSVSEDEDE